MPSLSAEQIRHYRDQGYVFPIPVLSPLEVVALRRHIEDFETARGAPIAGALRHKPHLLFACLNDLVRDDRILDAVAGVIGPNILCWESVFFTKEPATPHYVSWHQDATYWGLEPFEVVTAWVALSPSTPETGNMRVIPGSHREPLAPHIDTFDAHNMLSRGQEIAVAVDEGRAVDISLQAGEMSLHDVKLAHSSPPNCSNERRIGLAIRYIPPHVRQTAGAGDSATLVRGVDGYRHFVEEPRPVGDFSEKAQRQHEELRKRRYDILMRPV